MRLYSIIAVIALSASAGIAQQTKDPSGACIIESTGKEINAQTGTFICIAASPGSSTGTWQKIYHSKFDACSDTLSKNCTVVTDVNGGTRFPGSLSAANLSVAVTSAPNAAACDGSTDDSANINAKLSALPSGATLYIPDSLTCKAAAQITVPAGVTFTINSGATLASTASSGYAVSVGANSQLIGVSQTKSNVTVANDIGGIGLVGSGAIYKNLTLTGPCVLIAGQCTVATVAASQGIASGSSSSNQVVDSAVVQNFKSHGINTGGATSFTVKNSVVQGVRNDCILLGAGSDKSTVINNTITSCGSNGVDVNASHVTASGNVITGAGYNFSGSIDSFCMLISSVAGSGTNADYNTFSFNTCSGGYGDGIRIRAEQASFHANHNQIISNTIDGNQVSGGDGVEIDVSPGVCGTMANTLIQGNVISGFPGGTGVAIGGGGSACTVTQTQILGNQVFQSGTAISYGIITNAGTKAVIDGNVSTGNTNDYYTPGSTGTHLGTNSATDGPYVPTGCSALATGTLYSDSGTPAFCP